MDTSANHEDTSGAPAARRLRARAVGPWAGALILAGALAPIALPFLSRDFPQGHDAAAHLANAFRFNRALAAGEFPVRWVRGLTPGHGQPLFNFYQVGFYYFVSLLHATGLPLSASFKLVPVLLWWGGAWLAALWLRPWGWMPALSGAAVFALSPYIIIDGFLRAAYPELAGIVFAVGALWSSDAYIRRARPAFAGVFAIFVALMLVCHLPVALILAPALVVEIAFVGLMEKRTPRRVAVLAVAAACGLGLAAFYVVPALLEMPLVQMRELTTGGVDFRQQFVPAAQWFRYIWSYSWNYKGTSVTDPSRLMPLQVGVLQWLALLAGVCGVAWRIVRRRAGELDAHVAGWCAAAGLSLLMMHHASAAIWEAVPSLAFIQFPWRYFALLSVACAPLTAIALSRVGSDRWQLAAMLIVLGVSIHLYDRRLIPSDYLPRDQFNIDDSGWTARLRPARRELEEPGYDPQGAVHDTAPASEWTLMDGSARISDASVTDTGARSTVFAATPARVRLNIPAFPGWRISVDGQPANASPTPEGYQAISLGPGEHQIEARFTNTWIRTASNAVTILSGLLLAVAMGAAPLRRRLAR